MKFSAQTSKLLNRAFEPGQRLSNEQRRRISAASDPWMRVDNNADDGSATIWIYGDISSFSWWDDENTVTTDRVIERLEAINADTIHVRINSGGGEVFVANAIATLLSEESARTIAHIDGICASAATTIAMGCDERIISEGASWMIHKPLFMSYGNADALRSDADLLDTVEKQIIARYARKTDISKEELANLMAAETWYAGEEAVEAGFCDRLAEESEPAPAPPANSRKKPKDVIAESTSRIAAMHKFRRR